MPFNMHCSLDILDFLGVFQSLVRFSKNEWGKVVIRSGNAFPFMNLLVNPGGHQERLLWDLL